MVFYQGRWICIKCGTCFRKRLSNGCAYAGRKDGPCVEVCRIASLVHVSHDAHAARDADGTNVTFCSLCGAYGTTKAVLLRGRIQSSMRPLVSLIRSVRCPKLLERSLSYLIVN